MKKYSEIIFYATFCAGLALGTSSFTLISALFKTSTGWIVVASVILAALFCILIASSIAELASMYPSAPGIRTYLKEAFSNRFSLFFVYLYLIFMVLVAGIE